MERVGALQSAQRIDLVLADIEVVVRPVDGAVFHLHGRSEIAEGEVTHRFAVARILIRAVICILVLAVLVGGTAAVNDGEADVVRQRLNDGILTVITAVAGRLLQVVPVFVDPHVAFNGDKAVQKRDGHDVGPQRGRLVRGYVEHVVSILIRSFRVEVIVVGVILDQGVICDYQRGASFQCEAFILHLGRRIVSRLVEDKGDRSDRLLILGHNRTPAVHGAGTQSAIRRNRFVHGILRIPDGAGVVIYHIILVGAFFQLYSVALHQLDAVEHDIPLGTAAVGRIADLWDDISNDQLACRIIITVVYRQTPFHPAILHVVGYCRRIDRARRRAEAAVHEAFVLVALNALGKRQVAASDDRELILAVDPDVILGINIRLILFIEAEIVVHALLMELRRVSASGVDGRGGSIKSLARGAIAGQEGVSVEVVLGVIRVLRGGQICFVLDKHAVRRLIEDRTRADLDVEVKLRFLSRL